MEHMAMWRILDGRGPSSPHYESQAPSLDCLEPCGERLAHDEERLDSKGERLAMMRSGYIRSV